MFLAEGIASVERIHCYVIVIQITEVHFIVEQVGTAQIFARIFVFFQMDTCGAEHLIGCGTRLRQAAFLHITDIACLFCLGKCILRLSGIQQHPCGIGAAVRIKAVCPAVNLFADFLCLRQVFQRGIYIALCAAVIGKRLYTPIVLILSSPRIFFRISSAFWCDSSAFA